MCHSGKFMELLWLLEKQPMELLMLEKQLMELLCLQNSHVGLFLSLNSFMASSLCPLPSVLTVGTVVVIVLDSKQSMPIYLAVNMTKLCQTEIPFGCDWTTDHGSRRSMVQISPKLIPHVYYRWAGSGTQYYFIRSCQTNASRVLNIFLVCINLNQGFIWIGLGKVKHSEKPYTMYNNPIQIPHSPQKCSHPEQTTEIRSYIHN